MNETLEKENCVILIFTCLDCLILFGYQLPLQILDLGCEKCSCTLKAGNPPPQILSFSAPLESMCVCAKGRKRSYTSLVLATLLNDKIFKLKKKDK